MKMNTSNGTDEESCLYSSAGTLAFVRASFVLEKSISGMGELIFDVGF